MVPTMSPEQQGIVAQRSIEGVPIRTIGQELGTSHVSVLRARNKPHVRAFIEAEITNLITRGLKPARQTLCRLAALGNVKGQDKDTLALSLKASTTILNHIAGQPGTIINNLIQINNNEIPPSIAALFNRDAHLPVAPIPAVTSLLGQDEAIDI
jgi:hypothetical protein